MPCETIIVAYESNDHATTAVRALRRIGIPPSDIKRHPSSADSLKDVAAAPEAPTGRGFFQWLFGKDTVNDRIELYKKALEAGGTVLSVQVITDEVHRIRAMLQEFGPLDLEIASDGS